MLPEAAAGDLEEMGPAFQVDVSLARLSCTSWVMDILFFVIILAAIYLSMERTMKSQTPTLCCHCENPAFSCLGFSEVLQTHRGNQWRVQHTSWALFPVHFGACLSWSTASHGIYENENMVHSVYHIVVRSFHMEHYS